MIGYMVTTLPSIINTGCQSTDIGNVACCPQLKQNITKKPYNTKFFPKVKEKDKENQKHSLTSKNQIKMSGKGYKKLFELYRNESTLDSDKKHITN